MLYRSVEDDLNSFKKEQIEILNMHNEDLTNKIQKVHRHAQKIINQAEIN